MIDNKVLERHGLKPDEYDRIVAFMGREPNLTELGIFSVMWSEHCSYKSSRVHLKTLPTGGPQVLQGPGENAGAVDIGEGLHLAHDRREARDCAGPQIVAVGKAARKDQGVGALEVGVFVPDELGVLAEHVFRGVVRVVVAIAPGKHDDAELHGHSTSMR